MSRLNQRKLDRKITSARLAIGFERVWAAALWPFLIISLFLTVLFSGVLPWLGAPYRLSALSIILGGFAWSLRPLLRLVWPDRHAGMRRIEHNSALPHRPVSSFDDQMSEDDAVKQAIWQEHKSRQLRDLANLRVGSPRSTWRDLDARALRVPASLAVIASLLLGQGSPSANLTDSLELTPETAQAASLALDAWLTPPAYTAKAPVMLSSPAMVERLKIQPDILVPENSTLTLRISNAAAPKLSFHEISDSSGMTPEIKGLTPNSKTEKGQFQSETKLTRPLLARISDGSRLLASWRILLVPDTAPMISVTEDPKGDGSGSLTVKWKATDDYGVTALRSEISLSDNQDGGIGIEGNGIFLFEPPKLPMALRKAAPREEISSSSANLTEHPWAGLNVELELTAKDAAGHEGASKTVSFRLPERMFTKPLAKALIEQRRHLIMKPDEQGQMAEMLEALVTYPEGLVDSSGPLIAIAAVISRLRASAGQDDVDVAIKLLWQTAVGIEEGSLSDARAALEAIRKELERALAEGASPEKLAELMDKMRKAMDRYMQSLMQETEKRMRAGTLDQNPQSQGRAVSPQDLQKMMDMIEKLAKGGANEAAKDLLAQLDEILRNLQPGSQTLQGEQGDGQMSKMLDELSELMRKQQGLMDDTQRMPQDGGEPSDEGAGEPGSRGTAPGGLADQQQGLEGLLQEFMRQLGQNGMEAPQSFGDAGKSMDGAEGSLRRSDREGALGQQGEAMAKLREGAQGLARQMMQQGQGQQGNYGRDGEARGDDRDPLGRPMPNAQEDTGPDRDMLPSEQAIARAREILESLRARAGEQLPRLERDYIERLLRGLY